MTALLKEDSFFTFDDYLEWESHQEVKHEYGNGRVFEMAGATDYHVLVTGNIFAAIHGHLRGKACRVYGSDMKLKIQFKHAEAGYYPNAMVVCDLTDAQRLYKTRPKMLVEVMSDFRKDHVEKLLAYQHVPSLEEYLVIDQNPEDQKAWIYRRATEWDQEIVAPGGLVTLPSIEFSIELAELYRF